MLFIFSENFLSYHSKPNLSLTTPHPVTLGSCVSLFLSPFSLNFESEHCLCGKPNSFYSSFPMRYSLHSYTKRPTQSSSFWTNKIKMVLFAALFCKQKVLDTLGFTHGKLGEVDRNPHPLTPIQQDLVLWPVSLDHQPHLRLTNISEYPKFQFDGVPVVLLFCKIQDLAWLLATAAQKGKQTALFEKGDRGLQKFCFGHCSPLHITCPQTSTKTQLPMLITRNIKLSKLKIISSSTTRYYTILQT